MVVEYIRYRIVGDREEEFESAYARAAASLAASEHCLAYELSRCVEDPEQWVLRIEWDSLEGHEQGFRRGPQFSAFFAAVKPFFEQIEEMRHYAPTTIVGTR